MTNTEQVNINRHYVHACNVVYMYMHVHVLVFLRNHVMCRQVYTHTINKSH